MRSVLVPRLSLAFARFRRVAGTTGRVISHLSGVACGETHDTTQAGNAGQTKRLPTLKFERLSWLIIPTARVDELKTATVGYRSEALRASSQTSNSEPLAISHQ